MSYEYEWDDDNYCIACGKNNPIGMKLVFNVDGDTLWTKYSFPREFQGYKQIVHGGMIALLLDEIMVNLPLRKDKIPAVSYEISVKLRKPLKINESVTARAYYLEFDKRKMTVKGEVIRDSDNEVIATGEAKCLRVKSDIRL